MSHFGGIFVKIGGIKRLVMRKENVAIAATRGLFVVVIIVITESLILVVYVSMRWVPESSNALV